MSLCVLSSSTSKLQVLLGGAVATSECPLSATVEDVRKDAIGGRADPSVGRSFDSITTSGTAVDLIPAPPSNVRRKVTGFSLFNDDTTTVVATVRLNENGTTRVLFQGSLLTDEKLFYSESRGWYAVDVNGAQKTTASTDSSTADSKAESAATRASTALSAATSLDTASDTAWSTGDSTNLSAATSLHTAQSTAVSTTLSSAESAATRASTALSTGTSAGLNASTAQSNETRQSTDQSTMRSLLNSGGQAGF